MALFESDFEKYKFILIDKVIIEQARTLIGKYGIQGLRTLDSIQLSTSISLIKEVNLFITSDKLLKLFLASEGLPTELPNSQ